MMPRTRLISALVLAAAVSGCAGSGDIVVDQGVGITAVRSACPAVGIPDYTGDVTLFRTPGDTTAGNIDLVATMTNVRPQCNDSGEKVYTSVAFDVTARRTDARGSRSVTVPYFVTVLRGGSAVISKRVASVTRFGQRPGRRLCRQGRSLASGRYPRTPDAQAQGRR
jgi:hypothetical protein